MRHVNVPGDELVRNPLLPAAFAALGNQELFETAVDVLVEVRMSMWMPSVACQHRVFAVMGDILG